MASPAQTIEGIVLGRVETGENHLRFSVFCGSEGLQVALLRKRRGKSPSPPDLFDQVELVLEKAQTTGLPFVRESRVLAKRRELALRHDRFQAASDLALLYLNNGRLLLEPQPLFNLLEIALLRLCEGGTLVRFFSKLFFFCSKRGSPGQASLAPRLGEKRSIDCPFRIGSSGGNQKQGIRRNRSSCRITSTLAQF